MVIQAATANMDTFTDFYQNSDYAGFDQDVRQGGSFGLSFMDVRQDAIEAVDPALPEIPFVSGVAGGGVADIDFGDGWRRHQLHPGFLDIQPPNQECQFRIPALHLRIAFVPEARLKSLLDERGLPFSALETFSAQFRYSATAFAALQDMWNLAQFDDPATHLMIDGLWLHMIGQLLAEANPNQQLAPARAIGDVRIRRVIDYIETHMSDPICVADLAAVAFLSVTQFSRGFKAALGVTPARYVLERRCARAERLLIHSNLPLAEVARCCGFRNTSYFWTAFKKVTGHTPAQVRIVN